MDRRTFLRAAALAAGGLVLPVGRHGWALAAGDGAAVPKRLVVVFLRGAVDGLSVVVPYADEHYRAARPTIALAPPGADDGVLPLDRTFALHPALGPLWPHWKAKRLAFVHASGDPGASRSHFEVQDAFEAGVSGARTTRDGWLNRLAQAIAKPGDTAALAVGETLPHILTGPAAVTTLRPGPGAGRAQAVDRPNVQAAFDRMYGGDDPLATAYRQGRDGRKAVMEELAAMDAEMKAADRGAPPPEGLAGDADRLARLIVRRPEVRLAFLAAGGWDTHVEQGAGRGQLARRLTALATGLSALADGLGDALADTVVVVMSEFGRTVAENGNGGTDHGHGNVMWLLGGPVAGGKVYGRWPGLAPEARFQGRDLAVTTDYRAVLDLVLRRHMGVRDGHMGTILPFYTDGPAAQLAGLLR